MKAVCILMIVISILHTSTATSQDKSSDNALENIDVLLEDDIRYVRQMIRDNQNKLGSARRTRDIVGALVITTKIKPLNLEQWNTAKDCLSNVITKADTDMVDLEELRSSTTNALVDSIRSLSETKNSIASINFSFDNNNYEHKILMKAINEADNIIKFKYKEQLDKDNTLSLLLGDNFNINIPARSLFSLMRGKVEKMKSELKPDIEWYTNVLCLAPELILDKLTPILDISSDIYRKTVLISLDKEIDRLVDNDKSLRYELANKVKAFRDLKKNESERRTQIDQSLVYAVYAMIAVLLFLFLGLRIFTDDVAKELIGKRSLVEVVGMAFMLITIIILGTGEKLGREILGTLLGTISGYIFARGIQKQKGEDNE